MSNFATVRANSGHIFQDEILPALNSTDFSAQQVTWDYLSTYLQSELIEPEHKLFAAVLLDAKATLDNPTQKPSYPKLRQETLDWLNLDSTDWPFDFMYICECLKFPDHKAVRAAILSGKVKSRVHGRKGRTRTVTIRKRAAR